MHRDGREQRRHDLRRDSLERDRRRDPAAGAQRRADGGDPVRERAVHLPEGPDASPALPGRRGCPWPPRRTARCPRRRRAGRVRPVRRPRLPPCTDGSRAPRTGAGARPFGWAAACAAAAAGIPRMRAMPQRHVAHSSCAGVFSASRATLVGAKTARGAACGRTRAQADRCPHNGVTGLANGGPECAHPFGASGMPGSPIGRVDRYIGCIRTLRMNNHVVPMQCVGVHRDDRRHTLGCNQRPATAAANRCRDRTVRPASSSTTPAASPWSPTSPAAATTRSCAGRLTALLRLEHRGARGAESTPGDGAGHPDPGSGRVLPCGRRRSRCRPRARTRSGTRIPAHDDGAGREPPSRRSSGSPPRRACGCSAGASSRPTPTAPTSGPTARAAMPRVPPAVRRGRRAARRGSTLERRTFCLRKRAEHATGVYFPSLSPRTLVYKGMLAEPQLEAFYPDLSDERVTSALGAGALPVLHQHVPRPGRWRTPTATSRTTARSTPCAATATGWPPARRCCAPT